MATNSKQNPNVATSKPITLKQAIGVANQQIWQREFNPDYDQVVKRISTAVFAGLAFGEPPSTVG